MGTRGLLGFIIKGVRKGAYNSLDSYPSGLGDAIIKFILSLTEDELEEMRLKVENLTWIQDDEVERLYYDTFPILHFPSICYDLDMTQQTRIEIWSRDPSRVATFRSAHPDFPPDIDDEEIIKRYLLNPFPESVRMVMNVLSWIPETGDIIQGSQQHDLLDRIWDGRQTQVIDETEFAEDGFSCEYAYWIDFENKVMEIEGVAEGTLIVPFKDLKIGVLEKMRDAEW